MNYTPEQILAIILDCGYADISMIADTNYDLDRIIADLKYEGYNLTLNGIIEEVFCKGIDELVCEVQAAITSTREKEDSDEKEEILENLLSLDPEEDVGYSSNCQASMIWFKDGKGTLYRELLGSAIDAIENNMGFSFNG